MIKGDSGRPVLRSFFVPLVFRATLLVLLVPIKQYVKIRPGSFLLHTGHDSCS